MCWRPIIIRYMKKLFYLLMLFALTSCFPTEEEVLDAPQYMSTYSAQSERFIEGLHLKKGYYCGHHYILIFSGHGVGLEHDPDCPCFTKKEETQ